MNKKRKKSNDQNEKVVSNTENTQNNNLDSEDSFTCQISVFLDTDISEEEMQQVKREILNIDGVKNCRYITSDEAWEEFEEEYFGDDSDSSIAEGFKDDNSLYNTAHYKIDIENDKVEDVVKSLEQIDGIRKINSHLESH